MTLVKTVTINKFIFSGFIANISESCNIRNVSNRFLKHRPSGPMLSISQNVRLSVCPFVRRFVRFFSLLRYCLNVFLPPFSQSRMSNIFRDSESLGKSNGKKWSQIWTFLFKTCLKSPRKKSLFLFCLTKHGGNHASQWIRDLWSKGVSLILAYL